MFRRFHNTLFGTNLSFSVTKPPFIQILYVHNNHCITIESVTMNIFQIYDNSTDISAQMQIAALIQITEPAIALDIRITNKI